MLNLEPITSVCVMNIISRVLCKRAALCVYS